MDVLFLIAVVYFILRGIFNFFKKLLTSPNGTKPTEFPLDRALALPQFGQPPAQRPAPPQQPQTWAQQQTPMSQPISVKQQPRQERQRRPDAPDPSLISSDTFTQMMGSMDQELARTNSSAGTQVNRSSDSLQKMFRNPNNLVAAVILHEILEKRANKR